MANRERKISDRAADIMERKGGIGVPNMVLRDSDTGKAVYDNRDATAMARQTVARGGIAANANSGPTVIDKWVRDFMVEEFMEEWTCPLCKNHIGLYLNNIYQGTVHTTDETKTPYVQCWSCWRTSEPSKYKNEEHKAVCENKYPWIEKLVETKMHRSDIRYDILQEYIKENTKGEA